jgi:Tol biopolymer transport system component
VAPVVARNGLIAYPKDGDLWTTEPGGSHQRRLTSGPGVDDGVSWSPDGGWLAFWRWPKPADPNGDFESSTPGSLMIINADGGTPRTVVAYIFAGLSSSNGVAWSPDGTRIAFERRQTVDAPPEIDIVAIGEPKPRTLVSPADCPAWSPDGRRLVYRVPDTGVSVIDADGTAGHRISTGWTDGTYEAWLHPSWSPDGRWITYGQAASRLSAGEDDDIYVTSADGSSEHNVVPGPSWDTNPAWSPNGTRIAFGRVSGTLKEYVVVDPDGGKPTVLPESTWSDITQWSPDGTKLIALAVDANFNGTGFAIFDAAGGPAALITASNAGHPSWQPVH